MQTPTTHFFTSGAAEAETPHNAVDGALFAAGLGAVNLITVNGSIPPHCNIIEARELPPGALIPAAYATTISQIRGEIISAAIAVAYPADPEKPAVVMDYAATGNKEVVEGIARRMAEEAMQTRELKIREIRSIAVQHRVETMGCVAAAVVFTR